MNQRLLSTREVADRLGIHVMSVYPLIKRGDLKALRITPTRLRVEERELNAFIERKKRVTARDGKNREGRGA